MRVLLDSGNNSFASLPEKCVVTIGTFDGVHRGHQEVLQKTVSLAKEIKVKSLALTFSPHPRIVHGITNFSLVASLDDRLDRLAEQGIDLVVLRHYTIEFANYTAEEFVSEYLLNKLGAVHLVVGGDVRFGKDNLGNAQTLLELSRKLGFGLTVLEDVNCPQVNRRWSSTWVRELLASGDVAGAAEILGHYHRLRGIVMHGAQRGRKLGYPTANLNPEDLGVVPADGVYAGWILRRLGDGLRDSNNVQTIADGNLEEKISAEDFWKNQSLHEIEWLDQANYERMPAAISIGTNHTFSAIERTVEAHVLGRTDIELYGEEVVVEIVSYLRPMVKFASVSDLLVQMALDVAKSAMILGVENPPPLDPSLVTAK